MFQERCYEAYRQEIFFSPWCHKAMARAGLYLTSFLLLLYCKIFIIPILLSSLGAFVNLFSRLAICSVHFSGL